MGHQTCQHTVYRLSCADFEALWKRSGGCCEICGTPEVEVPGGRLGIDHDPARDWSAVRGILCPKCNSFMRYVDSGHKNSPEAQRYVRRSWWLRKTLRPFAA